MTTKVDFLLVLSATPAQITEVLPVASSRKPAGVPTACTFPPLVV
jgi:hypothetical protein